MTATPLAVRHRIALLVAVLAAAAGALRAAVLPHLPGPVVGAAPALDRLGGGLRRRRGPRRARPAAAGLALVLADRPGASSPACACSTPARWSPPRCSARSRAWCCTGASPASSWRSTSPSTRSPRCLATLVFAALARATALAGAWDWVAALAAVAASAR